jgi:hypothetical protein
MYEFWGLRFDASAVGSAQFLQVTSYITVELGIADELGRHKGSVIGSPNHTASLSTVVHQSALQKS